MPDPAREQRIDDEILAGCFDEQKIIAAWHGYFTRTLTFPFAATAVLDRRGKVPEKKPVEVVGLDPDSGADRHVRLGVVQPGSERPQYIDPSDIVGVADPGNRERLNDWRYWMDLPLLKA